VVNPVTVNAGIIVPLTGADVDVWGANDVNPNMVAIDGLFAGVQNISVSNAPVTLTKPAGFTPTPSGGPNQAQNAVLRFAGVLTANVVVTLPLPGRYVVENLTTGNFQLQLQGVVLSQAIALPQGSVHTIYNDGANVKFVDLGKVGDMEFWAGINTMPAWVTFCTVPPYLYADGTVFNFSTHPYLGPRMGAQFGGNGTTTAATPDLRGRVPLAYDGTGARVTAAGCGITGTTVGSSGGFQNITLDLNSLPSHYHSAGIYDPTHNHSLSNNAIVVSGAGAGVGGGGSFGITQTVGVNSAGTGVRVNSSNGLDTTYSQGNSLPHNNMIPAQVAGIWVVKT